MFAFFSVVTGFIFIAKPKTEGVLPDRWWVAKIEENDNGFCVSWYAQYWREMSPANMPSLWLSPVRSVYLLFVMLPFLAIVHDLAHGADAPLENAMELALLLLGFFTFSVTVIAVAVIAVKRFEPSRMWFSPDGVYYDPPPSGCNYGYFGHGNLTIARRTIRGIRFRNDSITISGPHFLGVIPLHMRIPDGSPDIRQRVKIWAEEFDIAISDETVGHNGN